MSLTKKKSNTVTFPLAVFETADTKEDLEDWLLSRNHEFIKKIRKARQEDIQGKGKDWECIKKELRTGQTPFAPTPNSRQDEDWRLPHPLVGLQ